MRFSRSLCGAGRALGATFLGAGLRAAAFLTVFFLAADVFLGGAVFFAAFLAGALAFALAGALRAGVLELRACPP